MESFSAQGRSLFHSNSQYIQCAVMPSNPQSNHSLIACGCGDEGKIKLCDISSGSFSHELTGHSVGENINSIAWSPSNDFVLASCSSDCTIRVWDIRKMGSAACLLVLDQEKNMEDDNSEYYGDVSVSQGAIGLGYSGLSFEVLRTMEMTRKRRLPEQYQYVINSSKDRKKSLLAPNNYSRIERTLAKSHDAAVTSIAFSPDGQYLVSTGMDAKLRLWDLRVSTGLLLPVVPLGFNANTFSRKSFNPNVRNSLAISQDGSTKSAMVWCGDEHGNILG